jgi:hypothetical protein
MFGLKSVMLLIAGVAVVLALFLATASAEEPMFRASVSPVNIEGTGGVQVLTLGSGVIECDSETHVDERQSTPTGQIIETILWEECFEDGLPVNAILERVNDHAVPSVTLGTMLFKVPAVGCEIKTPSQLISTGITYTNEEVTKLAPKTIRIKKALTGIEYEANENCKILEVLAKGKNGTLKGESKLKATTTSKAGKVVSLEVK